MGRNLSDVTVKLNVEQPSVPINMGNLAVFIKGEADKSEVFKSYDDVIATYSENDAINQVANGYFNQKQHGDKLILITYANSRWLTPDFIFFNTSISLMFILFTFYFLLNVDSISYKTSLI